MPNDYQIAVLLQQQYDGVDGIFDRDVVIEGDRCSFKDYSDCQVVADEGSHDFLNWFNNFDAIMIFPAALGSHVGVEQGFFCNVPDSCDKMIDVLDKNKTIYCVGHSRGAARANIRAAYLIQRGYKVEVITFGAPRPGDAALANLLTAAPNRSYYNYGHIDDQDYVCDVPLDVTIISPYVHPNGRIQIDVPPESLDPWGILARHHLQLYTQGVKNCNGA